MARKLRALALAWVLVGAVVAGTTGPPDSTNTVEV